MELLEQVGSAQQVPPSSPATPVVEDAERAARRTMRAQIARLERELADAFVTAYPMGGLEVPADRPGEPRLLDLGELELLRDRLTERLRGAREQIAQCADVYSANRLTLERMLLEPGRYRFYRISRADIGEPGCGAWEVRPRLGLIGMLMGWWQVKLSSGCPLPGGYGVRAVARSRALRLRRR
jgi:hypothetical protein